MKTVKLVIRDNKVKPIYLGHPWVFSGALEKIPEGLAAGNPVELYDKKGQYLAGGYFNSYSQIAVRVWSREEGEKVNKDFFKKRLKQAVGLRSFLESENTNAYRLCNGESDFLPGLTIDRYGDYLVIQLHNRGIEHWRQTIIEALVEEFSPRGIVERSSSASRLVEKMDNVEEVVYGQAPKALEVLENGFRFEVDLLAGQKTGFFLDQRDKRQALMRYVGGKRVLNCFSYSGGFAVYAAAAGAEKTVNVDVSADAIALARRNAELNDLPSGKTEHKTADVKKYLQDVQPGDFDIIILDPPAFIKNRHKKKKECEAIYL